MRRFQRTHLAAAFLVIAATAPAAAADRHRAPTDGDLRPVGKAVDCISGYGIRSTRIPDDRTIDFYMRGGKIYRSTLPQSCPNLSRYGSFTHRTPIDQYCSTDTITVLIPVSPPIPGATCGLGPFQPVARQPGAH